MRSAVDDDARAGTSSSGRTDGHDEHLHRSRPFEPAKVSLTHSPSAKRACTSSVKCVRRVGAPPFALVTNSSAMLESDWCVDDARALGHREPRDAAVARHRLGAPEPSYVNTFTRARVFFRREREPSVVEEVPRRRREVPVAEPRRGLLRWRGRCFASQTAVGVEERVLSEAVHDRGAVVRCSAGAGSRLLALVRA